MKKKPDQQADFESNLVKLEAIISSIDQPDISIENLLKQYEEGVKLLDQCKKTLNFAQNKIEELQSIMIEKEAAS
ncbi:MAG: exodeoxyribonuclease VII small subunit [Puniceicoccales bacterium]|nr:exodeoxyribonuclease VII small subunit [Puniceicoccales bacterium]